jgi:predicted metal-dependent phosphoesterase TrpH
MNIDLHCHSTFSDGLLSPATLLERAHWRGVDVLALTDHDEIAGLTEARAAAAQWNIRFINGVEISVSWGDNTIHIIGLNIDPEHAALRGGLARIRHTRDSRAVRIGDALADAGIEGAYAGALTYAGNPALVSRAHFARYLVELGHASDFKSVFDHYLVAGKPGFVEHQWATLDEAVGWIRASGGMAVIAHPARYRITKDEMRQFITRFKDLGGEGIEVVSGAHSHEEYQEYALVAKAFGLLASRASDFHGPGESKFDLGSLPNLPADLKPVWHAWQM